MKKRTGQLKQEMKDWKEDFGKEKQEVKNDKAENCDVQESSFEKDGAVRGGEGEFRE